jgi:uncharacterized protein DUF6665
MKNDPEAAFAGLQGELMGEAARSLGIAGKRMEEALAVLAACPPTAARRVLLDAAIEATFGYVVTREAMGWRDTEAALDLYGVPNEVRARLGARPRE